MSNRQRWIFAALAVGVAALVGIAIFVVDWGQFNYVDETVEVVIVPPTE